MGRTTAFLTEKKVFYRANHYFRVVMSGTFSCKKDVRFGSTPNYMVGSSFCYLFYWWCVTYTGVENHLMLSTFLFLHLHDFHLATGNHRLSMNGPDYCFSYRKKVFYRTNHLTCDPKLLDVVVSLYVSSK
jgi:hypothetical protein